MNHPKPTTRTEMHVAGSTIFMKDAWVVGCLCGWMAESPHEHECRELIADHIQEEVYPTPAQEVYKAVRHLDVMPDFPLRAGLLDLLMHIGDEMSDENAEIIAHPAWIGLAEDLRWGVHDCMRNTEEHAANDTWKSALLLARAITGEQS